MTTLSPEAIAGIQQTANAYLAANTPTAVSAVGTDADSLLANVLQSLAAPVLTPVVWPATIPQDHPIRNSALFIRLWTSHQWRHFWDVVDRRDGPPEPGLEKEDVTSILSWLVILYSVSDSAGRSVFGALKPSGPSTVVLDCLPQEDMAAINGLIERFAGPAGRLLTTPLYDQGLTINGLVPAEVSHVAKNSDTTSTSTQSGV